MQQSQIADQHSQTAQYIKNQNQTCQASIHALHNFEELYYLNLQTAEKIPLNNHTVRCKTINFLFNLMGA